MILQFKGFNNNWCYTESENITWANVWVGKETRDYRKGGIRQKLHDEKLQKISIEEQDSEKLRYVGEMHKAVDKLIIDETHCYDEIIYISNGRFDEMENVCVVILERQERPCAYVFDNMTAYILNNSGKTVQKLC